MGKSDEKRSADSSSRDGESSPTNSPTQEKNSRSSGGTKSARSSRGAKVLTHRSLSRGSSSEKGALSSTRSNRSLDETGSVDSSRYTVKEGKSTLQLAGDSILGDLQLEEFIMNGKGNEDNGKTLKLANVTISVDKVQKFADRLKNNDSINRLILQNASLTDETAPIIAEALSKNLRLNHLAISSNSLGISACRAFSKLLTRSLNINYFEFDDNECGPEGAREIAEGLRRNVTVRTFCFNDNRSGAEGAIAMAEMLETNSYIREMRFRSNFASTTGTLAFAKALMTNSSLKKLNFKDNSCGSAGFALLRAMSGRDVIGLQEYEKYEKRIGRDVIRFLVDNGVNHIIDAKGMSLKKVFSNDGVSPYYAVYFRPEEYAANIVAALVNFAVMAIRMRSDHHHDAVRLTRAGGALLHAAEAYVSLTDDPVARTSHIHERRYMIRGHANRPTSVMDMVESLQDALPAEVRAFFANDYVEEVLSSQWLGYLAIGNEGVLRGAFRLLLSPFPPLANFVLPFRRVQNITVDGRRTSIDRSFSNKRGRVGIYVPLLKLVKYPGGLAPPAVRFAFRTIYYLAFLGTLFTVFSSASLEVNPTAGEVFLAYWVICLALEEIRELMYKKEKYQFDTWNIMDVLMLLFFGSAIILRFIVYVTEEDGTPADDVFLLGLANDLLIPGVLMSCLRFMNFLAIHPTLGPLMNSVGKMASDMFMFLVLLVVFIAGFALSFTIGFREKVNLAGKYEDPWQAADTLFFGLFEEETLSINLVNDRPFVGRVLMGAYLLITVILLVNLLIAMMSNTYTKIDSNSKDVWRVQLAGILLSKIRRTPTPLIPFTLALKAFYLFARPRREDPRKILERSLSQEGTELTGRAVLSNSVLLKYAVPSSSSTSLMEALDESLLDREQREQRKRATKFIARVVQKFDWDRDADVNQRIRTIQSGVEKLQRDVRVIITSSHK